MKYLKYLLLVLVFSCKAQSKMDVFEYIEKGGDIKSIISRSNVNQTNARKQSLLMIASYKNDLEMAKFLIENGADPNLQDDIQNTPFLYTGNNGNVEMAKLFLENGAKFDIYNRFGGTALIPAAERGHIGIVKLLSNTSNFPVNHVNRLGWTALMEAVILGDGSEKYVEIVKILLDAGADKRITDKDGVSVYQHAKARSFTDIMGLLE